MDNMNKIEQLQHTQTEIDTLVYLLQMEEVNLELNTTQRSVIVDILREKVDLMREQVKQLPHDWMKSVD